MRLFTTHYLGAALLLGATFAAGQTTSTITTVSGANYRAIVSPDSIASGWGAAFSSSTSAATSTGNGALVLPTTLAGVQLTLKDSSGQTLTPGLYMVSPGQINYVIPASTSSGKATLSFTGPGSTQFSGTVLVSQVAPALLSTDGTGNGAPAAQVLRVTANGQATYESDVTGTSTLRPIDLSTSPTDKIYIILYGTGIRLHSLNPVTATLGTISVPVLYAGAQSQFPGLDQIDIGPIPAAAAAAGTSNLVITVDGIPANSVQLAFH